MKRFVVLLAATLLAFGCATEQGKDNAPARDNTPSMSAGPTGRIRGVVRLQGALPTAAVEPVKEHQEICGHDVSLPRIVVGEANGIQDTFVYLDGIQDGRSFPKPESVLVDQRQCRYSPHVMIVPVGTKLEITNSDAILHNVHGLQMTDQGPQTIFNIAQPVRGQRTTVEPALTKPGIVYLACEAGHAWMNAYVFVASHPYVTVTNHAGEFVMAAVPVGTYRIKMWHEGVIRKRNIESLQRYEYEDPYEMTQDVVVQPGAETVVNFDLSLRPST
jgi:plastocyanin